MATPRDRVAALNLYATTPNAFDHESELLATAYATHVGMLLAMQERESNLRAAIRSRRAFGSRPIISDRLVPNTYLLCRQQLSSDVLQTSCVPS